MGSVWLQKQTAKTEETNIKKNEVAAKQVNTKKKYKANNSIAHLNGAEEEAAEK